jgi:hypothetical protein
MILTPALVFASTIHNAVALIFRLGFYRARAAAWRGGDGTADDHVAATSLTLIVLARRPHRWGFVAGVLSFGTVGANPASMIARRLSRSRCCWRPRRSVRIRRLDITSVEHPE